MLLRIVATLGLVSCSLLVFASPVSGQEGRSLRWRLPAEGAWYYQLDDTFTLKARGRGQTWQVDWSQSARIRLASLAQLEDGSYRLEAELTRVHGEVNDNGETWVFDSDAVEFGRLADTLIKKKLVFEMSSRGRVRKMVSFDGQGWEQIGEAEQKRVWSEGVETLLKLALFAMVGELPEEAPKPGTRWRSVSRMVERKSLFVCRMKNRFVGWEGDLARIAQEGTIELRAIERSPQALNVAGWSWTGTATWSAISGVLVEADNKTKVRFVHARGGYPVDGNTVSTVRLIGDK